MTEDYYNNMIDLYDRKIARCEMHIKFLDKSINDIKQRIKDDEKKPSGNWFTRWFRINGPK